MEVFQAGRTRMKARGSWSRSWRRSWRGAGAGAIALLGALAAAGLGATPAMAKACKLTVYDSVNGVQGDRSDAVFEKKEQFIACITAKNAGYVSLWDRIPLDGPIERLGPSPDFEDDIARQVGAGETVCFGDAKPAPNNARYLLNMDPEDGPGNGRLWVVFSETLEDHPTEASLDSIGQFALTDQLETFGAGASPARDGAGGGAAEALDASGCVASGVVEYDYRVNVPRP